MRQLPMILLFVVALSGAAAGLTPAELANNPALNKCSKPDAELIKPGTADTYNAQAKGFNDCLRIYVENENNKIARLRADASGQFDTIQAGALTQIRDIERAINTAIAEVGIVNGVSQPGQMPLPAASLASFPAPECARPDDALLKPTMGRKAASLANLDKYEVQVQGHASCIKLYIAQAKNQIVQIKANAEAQIKAVADETNPKIHAINIAVAQALQEAQQASGERNARVNVIHSPLAMGGLDPAQSQGSGMLSTASFQPPGAETRTAANTPLPRSADMPTGAGDPDAISCRAPQRLTDSRLMGPEICKRNRVWASLYKQGKTISADGQKIVDSEKGAMFGPEAIVR